VQAALRDASIAHPTTKAPNDPGPDAAERQQFETNDIAALRRTVEQLAAGQEQSAREIAKLQTEMLQTDKPLAEKPDKPMMGRVSAGPAPRCDRAGAQANRDDADADASCSANPFTSITTGAANPVAGTALKPAAVAAADASAWPATAAAGMARRSPVRFLPRSRSLIVGT
jgi:hypothetical protein